MPSRVDDRQLDSSGVEQEVRTDHPVARHDAHRDSLHVPGAGGLSVVSEGHSAGRNRDSGRSPDQQQRKQLHVDLLAGGCSRSLADGASVETLIPLLANTYRTNFRTCYASSFGVGRMSKRRSRAKVMRQ
jgi:hypothetical protein